MRMTITTMATALAMAATLMAGPAAAQGHHGARSDSVQGGMGMMQDQSGMMQGGMMQMMRGMHGQQGVMGGGMMGMPMGPGMVLRLQESLELTEDQIAQLEALRDSARATMRRHMLQGMQGMRAASELLTADSPDLDAYGAQLREAMNHMTLAHVAMARAGIEARQALTPEQRDRLSLARRMMDEMGSGMMGDGMMGSGMMRGGMMNRGGGNGSGG